MDVRTRLERARGRLDLPVIGRIAQSALAAGGAWELALRIPGHDQPFFAPIAAGASVQSSVGWLALACPLFYIFGFAIGLGPVFWLMISEIFPLQMRGPAMAVCTMFNWGFNFLIAYTFLTLTDVLTKSGAFWLYAFFGICALVFFATLVPETKDRTLEQIQSDLGSDADTPLSRDRAGEPEEARA